MSKEYRRVHSISLYNAYTVISLCSDSPFHFDEFGGLEDGASFNLDLKVYHFGEGWGQGVDIPAAIYAKIEASQLVSIRVIAYEGEDRGVMEFSYSGRFSIQWDTRVYGRCKECEKGYELPAAVGDFEFYKERFCSRICEGDFLQTYYAQCMEQIQMEAQNV